MKFFSQYYKEIINRPYIKFKVNLFNFRNSERLKLQHILTPHFYLNIKNLKIKIFKNNVIYSNIYFLIIIIILFVVILFSFSRLMVRITGFHPVDSGSIPG